MPALVWMPVLERPDLLGPVRREVENTPELAGAQVTAIDPAYAGTEEFCEHYGVSPADCANCVVVAGRRGPDTTYAACRVLARPTADVNNVVRRHLGARKASFAPLAEVEAASGQAYGAITPIGLPPSWAILISDGVASHPAAIIGSGVRGSKLRLPGCVLAALPGAEILPSLAI